MSGRDARRHPATSETVRLVGVARNANAVSGLPPGTDISSAIASATRSNSAVERARRSRHVTTRMSSAQGSWRSRPSAGRPLAAPQIFFSNSLP